MFVFFRPSKVLSLGQAMNKSALIRATSQRFFSAGRKFRKQKDNQESVHRFDYQYQYDPKKFSFGEHIKFALTSSFVLTTGFGILRSLYVLVANGDVIPFIGTSFALALFVSLFLH